MDFVFRYPGTVDRWIDGDTVVVHYRKTPREHVHEEHVRLEGVNTPELTSPFPDVREQAKAAKAFSEQFAPPGSAISLAAHSTDKYGRMLAFVYNSAGESIADALIAAGHGVPM